MWFPAHWSIHAMEKQDLLAFTLQILCPDFSSLLILPSCFPPLVHHFSLHAPLSSRCPLSHFFIPLLYLPCAYLSKSEVYLRKTKFSTQGLVFENGMEAKFKIIYFNPLTHPGYIKNKAYVMPKMFPFHFNWNIYSWETVSESVCSIYGQLQLLQENVLKWNKPVTKFRVVSYTDCSLF